MRIPTCYTGLYDNAIYIEYLVGQPIESFQVEGFTQAYLEFQHQDINKNIWLDLLNQWFRGFDYKIGGVAFFMISRRENLQLAYKILKIYKELKNSQQLLDRK